MWWGETRVFLVEEIVCTKAQRSLLGKLSITPTSIIIQQRGDGKLCCGKEGEEIKLLDKRRETCTLSF